MESTEIKILLAEDHDLTRQGLAFGLRKYNNFRIVAESENGKQALDYNEQFRPDVVLMDIVMPVLSGITTTKIIKEKYPDTKIIMLTSHNDREKVLSAFKSGADAYCMKNIKIERLAQVIEMVYEGAVWLDPLIAGYLLEKLPSSDEKHNETELTNDFHLTNREKEILKLVAEGLNNKDIAQKLCLSLYTVKNHVSSIIQKMAVDDRTQAAILALKENIVKI